MAQNVRETILLSISGESGMEKMTFEKSLEESYTHHQLKGDFCIKIITGLDKNVTLLLMINT